MRRILFFGIAAFVALQTAAFADTAPVLVPLPDTKTVTVVTVEPTKTIETTVANILIA